MKAFASSALRETGTFVLASKFARTSNTKCVHARSRSTPERRDGVVDVPATRCSGCSLSYGNILGSRGFSPWYPRVDGPANGKRRPLSTLRQMERRFPFCTLGCERFESVLASRIKRSRSFASPGGSRRGHSGATSPWKISSTRGRRSSSCRDQGLPKAGSGRPRLRPGARARFAWKIRWDRTRLGGGPEIAGRRLVNLAGSCRGARTGPVARRRVVGPQPRRQKFDAVGGPVDLEATGGKSRFNQNRLFLASSVHTSPRTSSWA